jgi:hypothetical protein
VYTHTHLNLSPSTCVVPQLPFVLLCSWPHFLAVTHKYSQSHTHSDKITFSYHTHNSSLLHLPLVASRSTIIFIQHRFVNIFTLTYTYMPQPPLIASLPAFKFSSFADPLFLLSFVVVALIFNILLFFFSCPYSYSRALMLSLCTCLHSLFSSGIHSTLNHSCVP